MTTRSADSNARDEQERPDRYRASDGPRLRWTHVDTGLRVALVRDSRPASGRMTRGTAAAGDDDCWIFEVRPDENAEIYRRLDGGKRAALRYAQEWMADHSEGRMGD